MLRTAKSAPKPKGLTSKSLNIEDGCLAILLQSEYNEEIVAISKDLVAEDFTRTEGREVLAAWRQGILPDEVTIKNEWDRLLALELPTSGAVTLRRCISLLAGQRIKMERDMLVNLVMETKDREICARIEGIG